MKHTWLSAVFLVLSLSAPSTAVLIDSGDGSGNTTAPFPDPGWDNVGLRGSLGAIYLGNGWVLTANHVAAGSVEFDGITYAHLPSLVTQIQNPDGSGADLLVFGLMPPHPPLPSLPLASVSPSTGEATILIGPGRDRGPATTWQPTPPLPPSIDGYEWGSGATMRWGTNEIAPSPMLPIFQTISISTEFEEGATPHESQAAVGDSGGALFVENAGIWELAGLLFAIAGFSNQPPNTALYGNATYAGDIALYRDAILEITSVPEPRGGLLIGSCLLGVLARRFPRRRPGQTRDAFHTRTG